MNVFSQGISLMYGLSWVALLCSPWALLGIGLCFFGQMPSWAFPGLSLLLLAALPQVYRGLKGASHGEEWFAERVAACRSAVR